RREAAETRNQAEQLVYSTEKLIRDNPEKIPAEARHETETAIAELKERLKGEDTTAIRSALERASESAQKLGAALYDTSRAERAESAGNQSPPSDAGASGGSAEDEVVDAEIVDDDKREAG
ncbi:Hsp70 family protein, partial [Streptomyces sp. SID4985]|uniref:Hsp70 family protein n=1 Tax=Streptomyces sp. SID4985 TaxID=2690292 RepID=UPI00136BC42F